MSNELIGIIMLITLLDYLLEFPISFMLIIVTIVFATLVWRNGALI
jgi:hypothetical protein